MELHSRANLGGLTISPWFCTGMTLIIANYCRVPQVQLLHHLQDECRTQEEWAQYQTFTSDQSPALHLVQKMNFKSSFRKVFLITLLPCMITFHRGGPPTNENSHVNAWSRTTMIRWSTRHKVQGLPRRKLRWMQLRRWYPLLEQCWRVVDSWH